MNSNNFNDKFWGSLGVKLIIGFFCAGVIFGLLIAGMTKG